MKRILWVVAWVGLFLARPAAARQAEFEETRREAARELCAQLVELAAWCEETRLFASRERCLREVLALDSDHEAAREALGHKRQRDGSWKEPKRSHAPRDHAPEALPELDRRHAAAASDYCAKVLAAMERADPPLPRGRHAELHEELIALAPDDADVRAAFGEARLGEEWVLCETPAAKEGRARIREIVRAAYELAQPAREVPLLEREEAFGLKWTAAVEVPGLRVLGTAPREELESAARALQAARATFNGLLGTEVDYYDGATVFVLTGAADKEAFLGAYPGLDEQQGIFLRKLEGSGIPGTSDMAHWGKDARQRLDGIVRIGLGWLLYQAFGLTTEVGWVWEGLGIYLTRELLGTRLTWFVQTSEYLTPGEDQALRRRLMRDDTNWMNEANGVLQGEHPPRLNFVMGKTVNNMSLGDLLFSYVTAAYLLEGRANETAALLRRIGEPIGSPQAVSDVLGLEVVELEQRVRRWLTERR